MSTIAEKLVRENGNLARIDDLAGARVVVGPLRSEQNAAVEQICGAFDVVRVVDRREAPSHGYRAVHVVVRVDGRACEIQVRTKRQRQWAEISERLGDA